MPGGKSEIFTINVTVLEGRHYAWQNLNSYAKISIGVRSKKTKIKRNTDCPFYNEYFVFEFKTTLANLLDKTMTIRVYKARKIRPKKMLGYVNLDVATIWEQTDHQFYRKWAILTSPKSKSFGPTGYLKVTISILTKGEVPKLRLVNPFNDDEIEGNLLLPEGVTLERHRALYMFKVYKGVDIKKYTKRRMILADKEDPSVPDLGLANCWLEITFAGLTARTKSKQYTAFPIWNESLTISELFPPLSLRIKLKLYYRLHLRCTASATKYLQIRSIANDTTNGFLPTFGPSFIHFYRKDKMGEEYIGKVLIALETKLYSDITTKSRCVIREHTPPILETTLWNYETVLLFIAITDISFIRKTYNKKNISIEVRWGRTKYFTRVQDANTVEIPIVVTPTYATETKDKYKWYIDLKEIPCMHILVSYPNARQRLYNSNLIENLEQNVKKRLTKIERLFEHATDMRPNSNVIGESLVDLFDHVSVGCRNIIDLLQPVTSMNLTNLDSEKIRCCLQELKAIESQCHNAYNFKSKKKSYRKAEKIRKKLMDLTDFPQECWPDVILWLRYGDKRISAIRLPIKSIVYADIPDMTGINCGKVGDYYFKTSKISRSQSSVLAKVEAFMWVGPESQKDQCFAMLPQTYILAEDHQVAVPTFLRVDSKLVFTCRVHIYQGRFLTSYDYSGLSDFFARVTCREQTLRTEIMKQSLNPIWDQTLVFRNVVVTGTVEDIQKRPPSVLIEVLDKDICNRLVYAGHSIVKGIIKLRRCISEESCLKWWDVVRHGTKIGEIMAIAEFLEFGEEKSEKDSITLNNSEVLTIPNYIKPKLFNYRLEIMFWGIRDVKHAMFLTKPRVLVEIADSYLLSETFTNIKKNHNFTEPIKFIDIEIPLYEQYVSPIAIKLLESKMFGQNTYIGVYTSYLKKFYYIPLTRDNWVANVVNYKKFDSLQSEKESVIEIEAPVETYFKRELSKAKVKIKLQEKMLYKKKWKCRCLRRCSSFICRLICSNCFKNRLKKLSFAKEQDKSYVSEAESEDEDMIDWWTKYYCSLDDENIKTTNKNFKLKIFDNELEKQRDFSYLSDILTTFNLSKGKITGDEIADEENIVARLKGKIMVYSWPPPEDVEYVTPWGHDLESGYFQGFPSNFAESFLLRVYCIRAIKLKPMDYSGMSDPYLVVKMGDQIQNDRKHYVKQNVNPVFGRCFEFNGTFPQDYSITVEIWDFDRASGDDFIGKTKIDIENRLYTRHRASCGLQYEYKETGATPWRDQKKPSDILDEMCKKFNLPMPIYTKDSVNVSCVTFKIAKEETKSKQEYEYITKETLALEVLHNWNTVPAIGCHLVPEHVETRSLYNKKYFGIEQGKIQLWIDVFPLTDLPPPEKVNIKPRIPIIYELRVIIWNTSEVILVDDGFFGDPKSDIYVKGWIGRPEDAQVTDIHYRSLNGEGNFNWRFKFEFEYLSTENRIIVKDNEKLFELDTTEVKMPCKLKLQVFDNDLFGPDDFLGALTISLNKIPRGAKISKQCTLKQFEPEAPTLNLFRIKKTRGWWPIVTRKIGGHNKITGKLDAEFQLFTLEEALANPAGLGRASPNPLPPPNRPETSFPWFTNPLRTCKFIVWKHMKVKLLKIVCCTLLAFFLIAGLYSIPANLVKKIIGV